MANHTFAENVHHNTEAWLNAKAAICEKGVDCPLSTPVANVSDKIRAIIGQDDTSLISLVERGTKKIVVPFGASKIGKWAFYKYPGDISLPEGIEIIDEDAFKGCEGITKMIIPDSVVSIYNEAFSECKEMTSVIIGASVREILSYAFQYCFKLKNVVIPTSVTEIGTSAFGSCNALTDVYYRGTEAQWNVISKSSGNTKLTSATIHYNYTGDGSEL